MRWQTSYNLLQVNNQNFNFSNQKKPRTDPTHQLSFRASIDLSQDIYFDLGLRYVDQIAALNTLFSPARKVDSYVGIDLRLAWQAAHDMQLSIGTQNINQAQHQEFVEEVFAYPQQLQRSVYAKLQWYF
jgi:iron complex outermembrane receptor protein